MAAPNETATLGFDKRRDAQERQRKARYLAETLVLVSCSAPGQIDWGVLERVTSTLGASSHDREVAQARLVARGLIRYTGGGYALNDGIDPLAIAASRPEYDAVEALIAKAAAQEDELSLEAQAAVALVI